MKVYWFYDGEYSNFYRTRKEALSEAGALNPEYDLDVHSSTVPVNSSTVIRLLDGVGVLQNTQTIATIEGSSGIKL